MSRRIVGQDPFGDPGRISFGPRDRHTASTSKGRRLSAEVGKFLTNIKAA